MATKRYGLRAHPPWSDTLLLEPLYSVPTSGATTICGTTSTSVPKSAASEGPYRISVAGLLTPIAASVAGLAVIALTAACACVLAYQYSMQGDLVQSLHFVLPPVHDPVQVSWRMRAPHVEAALQPKAPGCAEEREQAGAPENPWLEGAAGGGLPERRGARACTSAVALDLSQT